MTQHEKNQRVLIVDDMPINIQVLAGALKDTCIVQVAANGRKCLDLASSDTQPDLILLDIMMPGMDGFEVLRRLKNEPHTKDIPVIFVSAKGGVEDEAKGLNMGAVDYIRKPFSPVIIRARVKTHLRLKHKTDLLESMALLDGLTEIPNRRRFDEVLTQEWRRCRRSSSPLSMIMADIDFFKNYNDVYGHSAGDDCLRRVAQTLRDFVRRAGDFVGRYGGEEFAVLLPDTDAAAATEMAEAIRLNLEALAIPHEHSDVAEVVTLSLGVASTVPSEHGAPQDIIEASDKQLYEAKRGGRNQVRSIEF